MERESGTSVPTLSLTSSYKLYYPLRHARTPKSSPQSVNSKLSQPCSPSQQSAACSQTVADQPCLLFVCFYRPARRSPSENSLADHRAQMRPPNNVISIAYRGRQPFHRSRSELKWDVDGRSAVIFAGHWRRCIGGESTPMPLRRLLDARRTQRRPPRGYPSREMGL